MAAEAGRGMIPCMEPAADRPDGTVVVDHPLVQAKLAQIRDVRTEPKDFRRKLRELSLLMAFEIARDLETVAVRVRTPLEECEGVRLARPVILAPILRAGLGMAEGMLSVFPDVSIGHIGMFRNEETLRPENYYFKSPAHLPDADVILMDPMLATGWSATAAVEKLKLHGAKRIRFACIVACPEGIAQLRGSHPDVPVFAAVVDRGLNEKGYILPGLGDAGDRYFGT